MLINKGKLTDYLKNKYPKENTYKTDKALYSYVMEYKK